MNLQDLILTYAVHLLSNVHQIVPIFVCLVAVWRVAKLRGLTLQDYQDRVNESVSNTIKEQMSEKLFKPVFEEEGMSDFLEWSLLRNWMEQWLNYLKRYCSVSVDPMVTLDQLLSAN